MTNCDTKNLLTRLQTGCPKTQRLFWDDAYNDVYLVALRVLKNTPDASAVAVEVLSDFLMDDVQKVSSPRALFSYLRITAARRAIRFAKKASLNTPIDKLEIPDIDGRDPEDDACLASLMPHLERCMTKLTPKSQQVLRLRYHRELTNQRIGELLGGSKQYIGKLVTQSIALLRKCMGNALSDIEETKQEGGIY